LVLLALPALLLVGCCKNYESDVGILCDVKAACPGLEEPGMSSAEIASKRQDCLAKKIGSAEGKELFAFLSSARSPEEKAARLKAEAQKANIAHCPDAIVQGPSGAGEEKEEGSVPPTPAGSAKSVVVTSVSGTGALPANVNTVVERMKAGFRRCHTKGLATDSTLQGSLELRVSVDGDGRVTEVKEASRKGLNDTVAQCAQARVRSATFDSAKGPAAFLLNVSFSTQGK
jgi:hypothetical protein